MPILKAEADLFPDGLFELDAEANPWWVAHVRPRAEKQAAREARFLEVPFYLPLREQVVRRRGRRQVSYLPLFPGYLFFRGGLDERLEILRTNRCVRVLDVLAQAELNADLLAVRELQDAGLPLVPHSDLVAGDPILVVDGPFKGYRGVIVKTKGRMRLIASVRFIGRSVSVELDREAMTPERKG
jgi:transcription antitermination factor NusG